MCIAFGSLHLKFHSKTSLLTSILLVSYILPYQRGWTKLPRPWDTSALPIPAQPPQEPPAHGDSSCQGSLHSAQGTGSHVSLLGPPAAMGSAEPAPLWPHSPAQPCPNAWGGAQCVGLPSWLGGLVMSCQALPCCTWGALTRTSKLILMAGNKAEGIHIFLWYLFGNAKSWKWFNMQWSQWRITSVMLLEYQGYILLIQTRSGNECHFLTKPLEHPWSQKNTKTLVKTM